MRLVFLFFLFQASAYCDLSCPDEYFLVDNQKCLRVGWKPVSHSEAEKVCTADGGTLVTIKNAEENQLVLQFAQNAGIPSAWIGLYCRDQTNMTTCVWDNGSGSAVSYNNFYEELWLMDYFKCVLMWIRVDGYPQNEGKWYSKGCDEPYMWGGLPYICEVPLNVDRTLNYKWPHSFAGHRHFRSLEVQEYQYGPSRATFENAKTACEHIPIDANWFEYFPLPGNLTSIHSKEENNFIRGTYRETQVTKILIGAQKSQDGRFTWLDGTNWDFEYFDPLDTNGGDCIVMDIQNHGLWHRTNCDQELYYHCKAPILDPNNELPPSSSTPPPLPDLTLSNCNSTLLIGPGSISTLGFPSVHQTSCTWNIMVLGPYQVGLFFDKWETSGTIKIFDEFGYQLSEYGEQSSTTPFSQILPSNSVKVTFQPGAGLEEGIVDNGFHAVVLPI